jgi:hypothetical protein
MRKQGVEGGYMIEGIVQIVNRQHKVD